MYKYEVPPRQPRYLLGAALFLACGEFRKEGQRMSGVCKVHDLDKPIYLVWDLNR